MRDGRDACAFPFFSFFLVGGGTGKEKVLDGYSFHLAVLLSLFLLLFSFYSNRRGGGLSGMECG